PYGSPFTGSGTEASVAQLTRNDLVKFHKAWFRPGNATLVVVGDTTMAEIRSKIEKVFESWPASNVPAKEIKPVVLRTKPVVYIIDKPGAPQSMVIAGEPAPSSADPDAIAIETMNDILGGDFVSRINMNIRENKHWSYGAQSVLVGAKGQRPFIVLAPVQSDKTKETIVEIAAELDGIIGKKPLTEAEFKNAQNSKVLGLPGQWETMSAVQASLGDIVRYGLPDDYFQKYSGRVQKLALDDLARAAKKVVHPEALTWVIVGDRAKIEPKIRELGFSRISVIDADGNIVK
ncbi:MAG: M16 family metallopeptidase, partial [Candidatus Aminicenantales bacterium]